MKRHQGFVTPAGLRERVEFWKLVFYRYGKDQVVLHHREFPQAIFRVLDFRKVAQGMSPRQYERYRKQIIEARTKEIEAAIYNLGRGGTPRNRFEQEVQAAMQKVPGGIAKYQRVGAEQLIRSQTGIREKYESAIKRAGRYLPIMEEIFAKDFALPVELTRLPFIESSFDYNANSSVGAAGIWQFMRSTGRLYLRINNAVDERRDPIESTRAAARYLSGAYNQLGSWPLAITSYNHGVGGVMKKVKKFGSTDIVKIVEHPTERVFGFASSNFYPEFLAAVELYDQHEVYFPNVQIDPPLDIVEVPLSASYSAGHVLNVTGLRPEELHEYNRGLLPPVLSGKARIPAGYTLKLPRRAASSVALLRRPEPAAVAVTAVSNVESGMHYRVRKGDSLAKVARKYGVTVAQLKQLNNLKSDSLFIGQTLFIKHPEEESKPAPAAKVKLEERGPVAQTTHTVKKGDTLWSISQRYGTSVSALKSANSIKGSSVRIGQKLRIP